MASSPLCAPPTCVLQWLARLAPQQLQQQQPQQQHASPQEQCAQLGGLPAAQAPALPRAAPLTVLVDLDNLNKNGNQLEDIKICFCVFLALNRFVFAWSFLSSFAQLLFSIAYKFKDLLLLD